MNLYLKKIFGAVLLIILIAWFFEINLASVIGIALVAFALYKALIANDQLFPIGYLALAISGIQWIVSPLMAYYTEPSRYPMAVAEDIYLANTLILYVPFYAGVMICNPRYNISKERLIEFCQSHISGIKVVLISGAIFYLFPLHIASLNFISTLLGCFVFVGAIMMAFAFPDKANGILFSALGVLFLRSLMSAMFHDLMVWGLFIFIAFFYIKKYSAKRKILIFCSLFFFIIVLQSIKPAFRAYAWEQSYSGNRITLFADLFIKSLKGELPASDEENVTSRFNQGWIISRIYDRIPSQQNYLGGQTIWEGIEATLFPRFLAPNKKDSGKDSIRDFETFTGYHLNSRTSMGLSILGEAYGNFGLLGGAIFMFLWGAMISSLVKGIVSLSQKSVYWYFFIPVICFNLIKAEINFISVLNWTVKSLLFVWISIFLINRYTYK